MSIQTTLYQSQIFDFKLILNNLTEEYLSQTQSYPWIVTFSGGKDSTLVAHYF